MPRRVAFGGEDHGKNHNGWHPGTSGDYCVFIPNIEPKPNPNLHMLFNNKITDSKHGTRQEEHISPAIDKAQGTKNTTVHIEKVKEDEGKVYYEDVNAEAEDYIQQRHKAFELSKWMSMKTF